MWMERAAVVAAMVVVAVVVVDDVMDLAPAVYVQQSTMIIMK